MVGKCWRLCQLCTPISPSCFSRDWASPVFLYFFALQLCFPRHFFIVCLRRCIYNICCSMWYISWQIWMVDNLELVPQTNGWTYWRAEGQKHHTIITRPYHGPTVYGISSDIFFSVFAGCCMCHWYHLIVTYILLIIIQDIAAIAGLYNYRGLPARWSLLLHWLPLANYWKMIFLQKFD